MLFLFVIPAGAESLYVNLGQADLAFRQLKYDTAAAGYVAAVDELESQNRISDARYLLRQVSDQYMKENSRYQTERGCIVAHPTYVKLSSHAAAFFERYCLLLAEREPHADEKLSVIGIELLGKMDFRGAIALRKLAESFPTSSAAPRALFQSARTWYSWAGIHEAPEARVATALELLQRLIRQYPQSEYVDDALLQLASLYQNEAKRSAIIASRWLEMERLATRRDASALRRLKEHYGTPDQVTRQAEKATHTALEALTQAIQDYPDGDMTPTCLYSRAVLWLSLDRRSEAVADRDRLKAKYPTQQHLLKQLSQKYGL